MCRVAKQRDDKLRAEFMAEISIYDPSMFIWMDETGCDKRNMIRKYGYSIRGRPVCDQRLLVRGTRYSAIPILSLSGIHDVYLAEGTINGDQFVHFLRVCLLPNLLPFNGVNPQSVVIIDNAPWEKCIYNSMGKLTLKFYHTYVQSQVEITCTCTYMYYSLTRHLFRFMSVTQYTQS